MLKKFTYTNPLVAKWVLICSLLIGIFSFTGNSGVVSSVKFNATQTEWILKNKKPNFNNSIKIDLSSAVYQNNKDHQISDLYITNILLEINVLKEVQFDVAGLTSDNFILSSKLLQLKTIPCSSKEDDVSATIG